MSTILVASGTVTGSLVGLAAAMLVSPFGRFSGGVVLAAVAIGVVLDGIRLAAGGPPPPASGRQVPQEWGRLFDPRIVALLYGARLGVGPLTILSTWTWWSVTIAAALVGPMAGAIVGAVFGFFRLTITVGVSGLSALAPDELRAEHHRLLFHRLRNRQRSNWIAINTAAALAVMAVVLAGCSGDVGDGDGIDGAAGSNSNPKTNTIMTTPMFTAAVTPAAETQQSTIVTVPLEDVVRTSTSTNTGDQLDPAPADPIDQNQVTGQVIGQVPDPAPSSDPVDLAAAILPGIDGFNPVDEPDADRYLDLRAASRLQPDPTEEVALLETRGFKGGWTRVFRNDSNDVAVASVYQFEDAAEAEFYLEDGLITIGGYGGRFFDIEGQPGVRGFVQYFTEDDESGTEDLVSLGAAFQTGHRWHLVYFVGSADTVTTEVLFPAIAAQRSMAATA